MEVANYSHEETRESVTQYADGMTNYKFFLHVDEFVTKVEVCYTEEVIAALKFYTTKRVTPWYGQTKGWRTTFEADQGFCINALRGKFGPGGCSELGVVFAPKEIAGEGQRGAMPVVTFTTLTLKKEASADGDDSDDSDNGSGSDKARPDDAVFNQCTADLAPRAIVVNVTESEVGAVRVVTAAEYDCITRFPDSFDESPGEHCFSLAEGERIQAVGVKIKHKRLVAISFKTNMETSPFYGKDTSRTAQWLTNDEHPESYVGGFAFDMEENEDLTINRFAVLWTKPSGEDAASQQVSKAA